MGIIEMAVTAWARKAESAGLPVGEAGALPRVGRAARTSRPARAALMRPHLTVGLSLIGIVIAGAALAGVLAPSAPDLVQSALRLQAPSLAHPFGTDAFGRDLFSRVLYGARIALAMSVLSVALAAVPGTLLGLLAGYRRGRIEHVISRAMETWLACPGLLLAIELVARMGPSLATTEIALGVVGIPWFYRMARTGTLGARHALYVEAAQAVGVPPRRILLRHILPNLASPLVVLATLRLGTVLLAGGGLSFIGLGAQPPTPEWGAMLASGREYMDTAWWLAAFPGLALTLTVAGFNLLGDGLRDLMAGESHGRRDG